jgi:hypothetical protein
MEEKNSITEEMNLHQEWYKEAREQNLDTLSDFVLKLANKYNHDYGTICHAMAAAAIGAIWAINKSDNGGITGFQAGCIMWEFIQHWNYESNKCGLRIVDYDNLCYPQYEENFEKTITSNMWKNIQDNCKALLQNVEHAHDAVKTHWQSIVDGNIPFGFTINDDL